MGNMRRYRRLVAASAMLGVAGCVTDASHAPQPYLATYRPLQAGPGQVIASPTGSFAGRLEVLKGCFMLVSDEGVPRIVAFPPQVRAVPVGSRWGLVDGAEGTRAAPGDRISVGGASAPDPVDFIARRFVSPPPPGECGTAIFVSNAGFRRE